MTLSGTRVAIVLTVEDSTATVEDGLVVKGDFVVIRVRGFLDEGLGYMVRVVVRFYYELMRGFSV